MAEVTIVREKPPQEKPPVKEVQLVLSAREANVLVYAYSLIGGPTRLNGIPSLTIEQRHELLNDLHLSSIEIVRDVLRSVGHSVKSALETQ